MKISPKKKSSKIRVFQASLTQSVSLFALVGFILLPSFGLTYSHEVALKESLWQHEVGLTTHNVQI